MERCRDCGILKPIVFRGWCRACIEDADMSAFVRAPGRNGSRFSGPVQDAFRVTLARLHGRTCPYCLDDVDLTCRDMMMRPSVDHEIPVIHGGTHRFYNLRLAHWICNSKMGLRTAHRKVVA